MASSVSQLNNYSNFSLFSFDNKDLLMKGMLMKQNAIDENRGKLQQIRDQVANFSVVKDVDKKYLEERLVQTTDIINKYAGGDLSNPNLMNQLVSKFEEVVDDNVLNAVASFSSIIREDKQWESKKGTAEYNEKNRQYAMQNRIKYLQDGNVGAQYAGGGGFIKYTDIDAIYTSKEFQEFLKNSDIKAEYIRRENGTGYFASINKYEEIDPRRLQQAITTFLGEDGQKQLQIDAWAKYGEPTSEEAIVKVKSDYEQTVKSELELNEKKLDAIDKMLEDSEMSPEDRAKYEENKKYLEGRVTSLQSKDFNSLVTNPDGSVNEGAFKNVYTSIYEQNFLQDKFNLLYHDPILKDTKIDEVQFKTAEFAESKRMNDLAFSREERLIRESQWEMQGKPLLDANGNVKLDENGNPILLSTGGTSASTNGRRSIVSMGRDAEVTKEEADDIQIVNDYQKQYTSTINAIRASQGNNWDENSTSALESYLIEGVPTMNETITLSTGRKIKVTPENIVALEKLKTMTAGDNGTIRKLRVELTDLQRNYNADIDRKYRANPNEFRNANLGDFYYVEDNNGNLRYTEGKLPQAKGQSNFIYLMEKQRQGKPLTKTEGASLRLYKKKMLLADDELTPVEKNQLYRAYKRDVGATTANTLPTYDKFAQVGANAKSYSPQEVGYGSLEASDGVLEWVGRSIENGFSNPERLVEVTKEEYRKLVNTLSPEAIANRGGIGIKVFEGKTSQTKGKIFIRQSDLTVTENKSVPKIEKGDYFQAYQTKKEAIATQSRQVINKTQITILPKSTSSNKAQIAKDNATREAIRTRLNIPADYKGDIRFERIIKNAQPTDEFNVFLDYTIKDGASGARKTMTDSKEPYATMKLKDLNKLGVPVDDGAFTPFDASMGTEAAELKLKGTSTLYNKGAISKGSTNAREVFSNVAKESLQGLEASMRIRLKQPDFDLFKELSKPTYQNVNLSYKAIDGAYYLVDGEDNPVQLSRDEVSGKSVIKDIDIPTIKLASDALILEYIEKKVLNNYNLD